MQSGQRVALSGIVERQYGQVLDVGEGGALLDCIFACIFDTGFTMKKKTAIAIDIKAITEFANEPSRNVLPFTV